VKKVSVKKVSVKKVLEPEGFHTTVSL